MRAAELNGSTEKPLELPESITTAVLQLCERKGMKYYKMTRIILDTKPPLVDSSSTNLHIGS